MSSEDWIIGLISLISYVLIFASYRFFQYYRCANIFKKVQWIANRSTSKPTYDNLTYYLCDKTIASYKNVGLHYEEIYSTIPDECRIDFNSEQETTYVSEILAAFKNHEITCFFRENRVSLSQKHKAIYKLRDLDYYMYSFLCYLQNCVDYDSPAFREKIYQHKFSDPPYHYHNLTDFGRICYKLYLVVWMYCENTDNTKPLINNPQSKIIMEYLKKNEVSFWTYHP